MPPIIWIIIIIHIIWNIIKIILVIIINTIVWIILGVMRNPFVRVKIEHICIWIKIIHIIAIVK